MTSEENLPQLSRTGGARETCPSPVDSFITFEFFKNKGFPTIDDDDFDFDYVRNTEKKDSRTMKTPEKDPFRAQEKNMYDNCAQVLRDSRKKGKARAGKSKQPTPTAFTPTVFVQPEEAAQKSNVRLNSGLGPMRSNINVLYNTSSQDQQNTFQYTDTKPGPSQGNERRQQRKSQTRKAPASSEFVHKLNLERLLAEPLHSLGRGTQPSFHIPTREMNNQDAASTTECINVMEKDLAGVRQDKTITRGTRDTKISSGLCYERKTNKKQLKMEENCTDIFSPCCRQFLACMQSAREEQSEAPAVCEGILCAEIPCKFHDDMARAILAKYCITDLKLQDKDPVLEESRIKPDDAQCQCGIAEKRRNKETTT